MHQLDSTGCGKHYEKGTTQWFGTLTVGRAWVGVQCLQHPWWGPDIHPAGAATGLGPSMVVVGGAVLGW